MRQLNKVAARSGGTRVSAVKRIPNALSVAINRRNTRRSIIPYSQAGAVLTARLFSVSVCPSWYSSSLSVSAENWNVTSALRSLQNDSSFVIYDYSTWQNAKYKMHSFTSTSAPSTDFQTCIFESTFSNLHFQLEIFKPTGLYKTNVL